MGLAAGAQVPLHVDIHYYWRTHIRLHIPIVTNPAVEFTVGGETVNMKPGECWTFNSFKLHEVRNRGGNHRVHLVLDTVGGDRLMDRLQQALTISQRNQTRTGVLFLDLDRFKEINDRLGHHVGDQLLQEVAARLRGAIREADTVSRLGGDEFIVVLPELHEPGDAAGVAKKILNAISAEYVFAGHKLAITPSLGISIFPDHARDAAHLLRLADKAMYEAKQSGRNTYRFYGQPA